MIITVISQSFIIVLNAIRYIACCFNS